MSLSFNQTCLNEGLLPNYIHTYLKMYSDEIKKKKKQENLQWMILFVEIF